MRWLLVVGLVGCPASEAPVQAEPEAPPVQPDPPPAEAPPASWTSSLQKLTERQRHVALCAADDARGSGEGERVPWTLLEQDAMLGLEAPAEVRGAVAALRGRSAKPPREEAAKILDTHVAPICAEVGDATAEAPAGVVFPDVRHAGPWRYSPSRMPAGAVTAAICAAEPHLDDADPEVAAWAALEVEFGMGVDAPPGVAMGLAVLRNPSSGLDPDEATARVRRALAPLCKS